MTNDERIISLKAEVAKRREELSEVKRFSPITSCTLTIDGVAYNLHALNENELVYIACKLNSLLTSLRDMHFAAPLILSGFDAEDWLDDIRGFLTRMTVNRKKKELKDLEAQLDSLLSKDKKTELDLNNIEAALSILA